MFSVRSYKMCVISLGIYAWKYLPSIFDIRIVTVEKVVSDSI